MVDDFSVVVFRHFLGFHHAGTHGSHLRTVVGIDNGGNDVSAEGRTDLVEQTFVVLTALAVVVVADFERCAVGGESAVQGRRNAGSEVAAYHCGAHEADLGLLLFEEVHQNRGVGLGCVGIESLIVEYVELVHAIGEDFFFHLSGDAVSCGDGFELHTQFIGQFAAFGEEFARNFLYGVFIYFAVYKNVVHDFLFFYH